MPISAEARGLRRVWKSMAAARFQRVLETIGNPRVLKAAREFSRRTGRHTAAALVLKSAFDGLTRLESEITGRHAELIWAVLRAGETPLFPTEKRSLSYDEQQAHACVTYLAAGWPRPVQEFAGGIWSCVVSDHALGRLLQRGPTGVDVDAAIYDLHRQILAIPQKNLPALIAASPLLVPSGPGAFWVAFEAVYPEMSETLVVMPRARSWLSADELKDEELGQTAHLLVAEPDDVVLAQYLRQQPPPLVQMPG
jgi:hypothetical protein